MKKILYCSAYYDPKLVTGANVRFLELARALDDYCELTVCATSLPNNVLFKRSKTFLVKSHSRLLLSIEIFLRFVFGRYDFVISDLTPNLPHNNSYYLVHDMRQFSRFRRHSPWLSTLLYKVNLLSQKNIVTVSNFSKSEILRICGNRANVLVSYNGISKITDVPAASEIVYDFLFVGTFEERKNHIFLIEAFKHLKEKCVDFTALFIGRDLGLLRLVKHKIMEYDLVDNITIIDTCTDDELHDFYSKSRVFVIPSLYEGFGMPVIEALNLGCSVICSDIEVFREIGARNVSYFSLSSVDQLVHLLEGSIPHSLSDEPPRFTPDLSNFYWSTIAKKFLCDLV